MKKRVYLSGCIFLCMVAACSKPHGSGGGSTGNSPLTYAGAGGLSEPRVFLASASAGNKAMFAGGLDYSNNSLVTSTADLYDVATGKWTVTHLSEPRYGLAGAAAGGKFIFAGGFDNSGGKGFYTSRVDIYDTATGNWTTAQLSEARCPVAASLGNWVFFAGGADSTGSGSSAVDIYNTATGVWSTAQLSHARWGLAAAAAGSKVVFAGGANGSTLSTVDIYDTVSGTWTTAQLSSDRFACAAAAVDGKIFIAGGTGDGGNLSTVDIYDVVSGNWTTAHLSKARENMAPATIGEDIVFAGGNVINFPSGGGNAVDGGATDTVDVYDARTNSWSVSALSQPREGAVAGTAGFELLIAGGAIPTNPGFTGAGGVIYQGSALVDFYLVTGQ